MEKVTYYEKNKEKAKAYQIKWNKKNRLKNPELYKERQKKYQKKYMLKHPEKSKIAYRKHREKNGFLPRKSAPLEEIKRKKAIRNKTRKLVREGKIKRKSCEICKNQKTEIHHNNYDNCLNIRWFCRKCHIMFHNNLL